MMTKRDRLLYGVVGVTLVLGIFFRFYHLDNKVYWHDEVFTSLRSAGYLGEAVGDRIKAQGTVTAAELLHYQRLQPNQGWQNTIAALRTHPEHPPLYYLGTRLWMECFGSSVAATRSFAAVISLFAFPGLYWLASELFHRRWVSVISVALFAVSPFQVLYAQEARQYSLWTVAVLFSSAALLWASRSQDTRPRTIGKWAIYSLTLILGLYTSLLFSLTLISHGLYLVIIHGWRHRPVLVGYLMASLVAGMSFIPWAIVLVQNQSQLQEKTAWTKLVFPLDLLMRLWGLHITSGFLDPGLPIDHPYNYWVPPLFVGLTLWVGWIVYRHTSRRTWLLLLLLIGSNMGALVLPDLLVGGIRSASSRYFVPTYVGVQLLMAYGLVHWLQHRRSRWRRWGQGVVAALWLGGIVSCAISAQSVAWWNKGLSYNNPATAQIVNQATRPLLLLSTTGDTLGNAISLSYLLKPEARVQLVDDAEEPTLAADDCDIFLYYPSESLLQFFSGSTTDSAPTPAAPTLITVGEELVRVQRSTSDCAVSAE